MADRNTKDTDNFATWRTDYNLTAVDIGDIANLNNEFNGTPTDMVESVNSKVTRKVSIALAVALG